MEIWTAVSEGQSVMRTIEENVKWSRCWNEVYKVYKGTFVLSVVISNSVSLAGTGSFSLAGAP